MFKSIYNGFWVPGETEYTGSSYLSQKHTISESKTFFYFLSRSYGLVHHTPRDNKYNPKACARLFSEYKIKAHDVLYRNGETVDRMAISILSLNAKPISSHIMHILLAYTEDDKLVGDLKWASQLLDRGIDPTTLDNSGPDTTCCIGFQPEEQKWYGWSHRAIYGFGVGSTILRGNCGYQPPNFDAWVQGLMNFYEYPFRSISDKEVTLHGKGELEITIPLSEFTPGKGEWEAQDLSDAKQMARDFAEGVF